MTRFFIPLAALSLSACATTGTTSTSVIFKADQGFAITQQAFKSLEQAAYASIKSGVLTGTAKAKAIDAVQKGAAAETLGFNAEQAGNAKTLASAAEQLGSSVTALQALGIKVN